MQEHLNTNPACGGAGDTRGTKVNSFCLVSLVSVVCDSLPCLRADERWNVLADQLAGRGPVGEDQQSDAQDADDCAERIISNALSIAVAGIVALLHDVIITVGVYAGIGWEVTPATVIGFLTILGYSLYDTVVVFDKVRENVNGVLRQKRYTYGELANLALNQTLVRSLNTSVVAVLPVGSILFIGAFLLGAGTLRDISLALFVGILVGTFSSVFIATPLLKELGDFRLPEGAGFVSSLAAAWDPNQRRGFAIHGGHWAAEPAPPARGK